MNEYGFDLEHVFMLVLLFWKFTVSAVFAVIYKLAAISSIYYAKLMFCSANFSQS